MTNHKGYYILIGICSGILIGLSLSPVIEKTLTLLITFITTLVGAACGISTKKKNESESVKAAFAINPMPFALVMTGIILGSFAGMLIRNNDLFGDYRAKASINAKDCPGNGKKKIQNDSLNSDGTNVTGLHADDQELCKILGPLHGMDLKRELDKLGNSKIDRYLKISTDSLWLEFIKRDLCR